MPTEPQIPTCYPKLLTAGTSLKVDRSLSDWPNTEWKYSLLLGGAKALSKDATADPAVASLYHLVLAPTDTAPLNTGGSVLAYQYVERVTLLSPAGTEKWDVGSGVLLVEPNLGALTDGQAVSHEEKTLVIIKAALEGRLTIDMESYSIAGRSISKIPVHELMQLRGLYENLVWRQRNPGHFSQPVDVTFPATNFPRRAAP